ncbi:MAG: hypothetical protein QF552_00535 [Litorilituus sp.]|nr:hypothetical protein [Litorilituus sp.]
MSIFGYPDKMIHQPEYMVCISLKFHVLNNIDWDKPNPHYSARGQAPRDFRYAMLNQYQRTREGDLEKY